MIKSGPLSSRREQGPDLTLAPLSPKRGRGHIKIGALFAVHNCKVLILARSETDKIGTALIPVTGDEHGPDLHPYPRFQERSGADIPQ